MTETQTNWLIQCDMLQDKTNFPALDYLYAYLVTEADIDFQIMSYNNKQQLYRISIPKSVNTRSKMLSNACSLSNYGTGTSMMNSKHNNSRWHSFASSRTRGKHGRKLMQWM